MHFLKYTCRRRKSTDYVAYAYKIMKAILDELIGISESHCEFLHHIIHHVLSIILLKADKEHSNVDLDERAKPNSRVVDMIGQWLHKTGVGHVKFGGLQLKKLEEEVRVSICIFSTSIKFDVNYSCMYAGVESVIQ